MTNSDKWHTKRGLLEASGKVTLCELLKASPSSHWAWIRKYIAPNTYGNHIITMKEAALGWSWLWMAREREKPGFSNIIEPIQPERRPASHSLLHDLVHSLTFWRARLSWFFWFCDHSTLTQIWLLGNGESLKKFKQEMDIVCILWGQQWQKCWG